MSDRESSLRDLKLMQERMSSLLEESLQNAVVRSDELAAETSWAPPADAFETEDEVMLLVDLAGVERADVEVVVEDGLLVVRGDRRVPEALVDVENRRIERAYGPFARSFELPATVEVAKIRAEHRDGVLVLRLPMRERTRGRSFQIEVE